MAGVGGPRPNSGRPKGVKNRKTVSPADQEAARRRGQLPHEFLLDVAQGREITLADGSKHAPSFKERMEAATQAAPYYQPKLSSVEQKTEVTMQGVISAKPLTEAEWGEIYGSKNDSMGTPGGATESAD